MRCCTAVIADDAIEAPPPLLAPPPPPEVAADDGAAPPLPPPAPPPDDAIPPPPPDDDVIPPPPPPEEAEDDGAAGPPMAPPLNPGFAPLMQGAPLGPAVPAQPEQELVWVEPAPQVQMPAPYFHAGDAAAWTVQGPSVPAEPDVAPCALAGEAPPAPRPTYLSFRWVEDGLPERPPLLPEEVEQAALHDADVRALAISVVRAARRQLNDGPFNNRHHLPPAIRRRCVYPKGRSERIRHIAARAPEDGLCVENENLPGPILHSMALTARATAMTRGGVCEQIALLVLGLVSTCAPPGVVARKVHYALMDDENTILSDHHYVVLQYGLSRYWVADPWPVNAYVLPLEYNAFGAHLIRSYIEMTVVTPVAVPFGVDFDAQALVLAQTAAAAAHPDNIGASAFQSPFRCANNLGDGIEHADPPIGAPAANGAYWG